MCGFPKSYYGKGFGTSAFNKERTKLNGACKQTFYVSEQIYLTTKRANLATKCSLIELRPAITNQFEIQNMVLRSDYLGNLSIKCEFAV